MPNIYIVDDDDAVRGSLHSLLSLRSNLLVRGFASGDAFLDLCDQLDPGVVLLDMHMPGASGLEVLHRVGAERRFVCIVLTGRGDVGLAVQAMKAGAMEFLEKPYDPATLLDIVDAAFSRAEQANAVSARADIARAKVARLSAREVEVLGGLIEGSANKVIAIELDLSPRTVEIHRAKLMEKLEARSLSDALRIAFEADMFP